MKKAIVTIGLKSFYAHTPTGAKHLLTIITVFGSALTMCAVSNATLLPATWAPYLGIATSLCGYACNMVGVKCPLDDKGKPVTPPSDTIQSLKDLHWAITKN